MKLGRILALTAFAVVAGGWLHADTVGPAFYVSFNTNPADDATNQANHTADPGTGGGGWTSGLNFTGIPNPTETDFGSGPEFQSAPLCTDTFDGTDAHTVTCPVDSEPSIRVNAGGASIPVTGSFGLFTNDAGGGYWEFHNAGSDPITELLLTSDNLPDSFFTGQEFDCTSDIFQFCDVRLVGSDFGVQFDLYGGQINPIPEPGYGVVFVAASGLLIWARRARRSKQV